MTASVDLLYVPGQESISTDSALLGAALLGPFTASHSGRALARGPVLPTGFSDISRCPTRASSSSTQRLWTNSTKAQQGRRCKKLGQSRRTPPRHRNWRRLASRLWRTSMTMPTTTCGGSEVAVKRRLQCRDGRQTGRDVPVSGIMGNSVR